MSIDHFLDLCNAEQLLRYQEEIERVTSGVNGIREGKFRPFRAITPNLTSIDCCCEKGDFRRDRSRNWPQQTNF
ncbi:hypothetical protein L3X38_028593 [Prunus dulcis]|uniref:Uncharacterized protein n=1 Tax=Prunus dulcis TaxID=3755 RepID=A0AAD4Z1C4_PRUDU|nr:hypothetical protein L3X38_028593 [Prunus dulcis]